MNLIQLRDRINTVIDRNTRITDMDRNMLPVKVRVNTFYKTKGGKTKVKSEFIPLEGLYDTPYGSKQDGFYLCLLATDRTKLDATK